MKNIKLDLAIDSIAPLFVAVLVILSMFAQVLCAQVTDNWPTPSVALYDCNSSAAITSDSTSKNLINSSSRLILQDILSDTSSKQVNLFSFGNAKPLPPD